MIFTKARLSLRLNIVPRNRIEEAVETQRPLKISAYCMRSASILGYLAREEITLAY
jgi:hypothetical protein